MLKRLNKNTKILLMKIAWLDFIIVLTKNPDDFRQGLVIFLDLILRSFLFFYSFLISSLNYIRNNQNSNDEIERCFTHGYNFITE